MLGLGLKMGIGRGGLPRLHPLTLAHIERVEAASGTVYDPKFTDQVIRKLASEGIYDDVGFFGTPDTGVLESYIDGDGPFCQSLYDLGDDAHDAVQTTASNQPRISRPDNKGNVLKWSEDLTAVSWTKSGSVADNTETLRENDADSTHLLRQEAAVMPAAAVTARLLVRRGAGGRNIRVVLADADATGNNVGATFSLSGEGSVLSSANAGNGTGVSASILEAGDFYLVSLSGTPNTSGTSTRLDVMMVDNTTTSYQGDNTSTLIIKEVSLRPASWDDEYVKTEAARQFANGGLKKGRRRLIFDGVDDILGSPHQIDIRNASVLAIFVWDGGNDFMMMRPVNNARWYITLNRVFVGVIEQVFDSSDAARLYNLDASGNNKRVRVNGGGIDEAFTDANTGLTGKMWIGGGNFTAGDDGAPNAWMRGWSPLTVAMNRSLSSSERNALESFLMQAYGIP